MVVVTTGGVEEWTKKKTTKGWRRRPTSHTRLHRDDPSHPQETHIVQQ